MAVTDYTTRLISIGILIIDTIVVAGIYIYYRGQLSIPLWIFLPGLITLLIWIVKIEIAGLRYLVIRAPSYYPTLFILDYLIPPIIPWDSDKVLSLSFSIYILTSRLIYIIYCSIAHDYSIKQITLLVLAVGATLLTLFGIVMMVAYISAIKFVIFIVIYLTVTSLYTNYHYLQETQDRY